METKINNSVVANNNSTISNSTIKSTDEEYKYLATSGKRYYNIKNSVVAQNGSQITNASIDITKEKRKSFWNGFSIGGIIASLIASAIWYFIQKSIE